MLSPIWFAGTKPLSAHLNRLPEPISATPLFMSALSSPAVSPPSQRSSRPQPVPIETSDRNHLLLRAEDFHRQARQCAEAGDVASAARLILQGLDCERRAGGLGPQVLQLIKPR